MKMFFIFTPAPLFARGKAVIINNMKALTNNAGGGDGLIVNCRVVNEGRVFDADVRIVNGRIAKVGACRPKAGEQITDANGRYLLPGLIDDQVHFREPGLTHKATIATESRAAVAGGITSFMEMPNVLPPTLNMELLEQKLAIASQGAVANYAFYLGAGNNNLQDIAAADPRRIAGVKIFMGASTGNLLVQNPKVLEKIFAAAPTLIATHCENTPRINRRLARARAKHGQNIPAAAHAQIRDVDACFESSSFAVALAKKTGARLHVLHITTAKELALFARGATAGKQITAEACAHHLLFDDSIYGRLGMRAKCNPAIKTAADRAAVVAAVAAGKIDALATDHAPHLPKEKDAPYEEAAAGMPLAEHALPAFLQLVANGELTLPQVARAGAHNVADLYAVQDRGYVREGYFADLVLAEQRPRGFVARRRPLAKCGWSPFAGMRFAFGVWRVFVNGRCVYANGKVAASAPPAMPLAFARPPKT